jgi:hypothetical protein
MKRMIITGLILLSALQAYSQNPQVRQGQPATDPKSMTLRPNSRDYMLIHRNNTRQPVMQMRKQAMIRNKQAMMNRKMAMDRRKMMMQQRMIRQQQAKQRMIKQHRGQHR